MARDGSVPPSATVVAKGGADPVPRGAPAPFHTATLKPVLCSLQDAYVETLKKLQRVMKGEEWMASFDLKDGFYAVSIASTQLYPWGGTVRLGCSQNSPRSSRRFYARPAWLRRGKDSGTTRLVG